MTTPRAGTIRARLQPRSFDAEDRPPAADPTAPLRVPGVHASFGAPTGTSALLVPPRVAPRPTTGPAVSFPSIREASGPPGAVPARPREPETAPLPDRLDQRLAGRSPAARNRDFGFEPKGAGCELIDCKHQHASRLPQTIPGVPVPDTILSVTVVRRPLRGDDTHASVDPSKEHQPRPGGHVHQVE